jgi:hypothetical protein
LGRIRKDMRLLSCTAILGIANPPLAIMYGFKWYI